MFNFLSIKYNNKAGTKASNIFAEIAELAFINFWTSKKFFARLKNYNSARIMYVYFTSFTFFKYACFLKNAVRKRRYFALKKMRNMVDAELDGSLNGATVA